MTDANLHYEGSITIDKRLMNAADIVPYERVDIYNVSNGERFSTYVIEGEAGFRRHMSQRRCSMESFQGRHCYCCELCYA